MAFAEVALEQAHTQQTQAQQALQSIRRAYHPDHRETAQLPSTAAVKPPLEQAYTLLEPVTEAASQSLCCREQLQKARRVITNLLVTVTFLIMTLTAQVEVLDWAPELETVVLNPLIPALYWRRVATQTTDREPRQHLHPQATELMTASTHRGIR